MADIRCPMCSKPNPEGLDACQYCGARLKPATDALAAANEPIRPGEEPTKKSTAELEKALPEWLRNIRQGDSSEALPAMASDDIPASEEDDFLSRLSGDVSAPQPSSNLFTPQESAPSDFLAGLAASGSDDEEIPDWLASIQGQVQKEVQQSQQTLAEQPSQPSVGEDDWLSRIQAEEKPSNPQPSSGWAGGFAHQEEESATFFEPEASSLGDGGNDWFAEPSASAPSDTPDWLKDLEASHPSAPSPSQPVSSGQEFIPSADMPDWLAGLDGGAQPPAPSQPASFASAGDDTPDWLREMESSQSAAPVQPAAPTSNDTPDWLRGLEADTPSTPVQPASFASASDDTPDWLREMDSPQYAAPVQPTSFAPASDDTPDWLKGLEAETPPAPAQPASFAPTNDDTSAWLRDLEVSEPAPATSPEPVQFGSDDLSSWFDEKPAPAVEQPQAGSQQETADWFSSLQPDSAQGEQAPADFGASAEMPDWLGDLQATSPVQAQPETPSFNAEVPDWLNDLGAAQAQQPQPAGGEDDWLTALGGPAPAEPASQESTPGEAKADEGIPDWLVGAAAVGASLQSASAPRDERPADQPDLFVVPEAETPEWLASTTEEKPAAAFEGFEDTSSEAAALPGQLPEWFTEAAPAPDSRPQSANIPAFIDSADSGGEILGLDMPDWLSNLQGSESAEAVLSSEPAFSTGIDDTLAPTELPSWVQAMRPVESVISESTETEEEQFVESQGPLAGMRNVLPIVTGLIAIRRPAPYSSKLQVNETQQSNAALLESMLSPESAGAGALGKPGRSMRFLRWMIALLLVVLVGLPVAMGSSLQLTPPNNLYPPELLSVVGAVEQLPQSPRVLVVVDYDPSFSGEMAVAATPLLDHLMLRQARLAIVSSIPTGVVQAEALLQSNLSLHQYVSGLNYFNLGYIPGGAVGIYNFANSPASVLPQDVNGDNPWMRGDTFLADISQLDQFDAMVVITDSSDTGRVWIEQSRRVLGDKPLLMAISAQAEPMLRPYVDSQQVQGMVTGLAGGAAYEQRIQRPGLGREYWDSFSVAFLVAEIIVIIGGVWALFAAWRSQRNQSQDEA